MKKQVYLIIVLLSFNALKIVAQTSLEDNLIVRSSLDNMFENLDKSNVPTGLLLDYAIDLVDLSKYSGKELSDSNLVNYQTFKDILGSIRSSSVNESFANNFNSTLDSFRTSQSHNSVNVGIAFYQYNFIKANALEDNLIIYDSENEKVSDAYQDGVWINPYGYDYVLAFSPSSNFIQNLSVTYNFTLSYIFSNQEICQVYFDAGDGLGYRAINQMSSISIDYASDGIKELRLRVQTNSGQIFECHSMMYLVDCVEDELTKADQGLPLQVDSIVRSTCYNGITVKAQMSYYSTNNDGTIRKPFIVVEGFDPWELNYLFSEIDSDLEVNLGYTNHINFANEFYSNFTNGQDYDLIYIDWNNSTEDIRANAQLLRLFLADINEMKANAGSTQPNVILGQSMGGLIARYALKTMENEHILHDVTTYISHDSPHLGANVPLGALYFIPQLLSLVHGYSRLVNLYDLFNHNILTNAESILYSVLHSMAARQMLLNYVSPEGTIDNSVHNEWQEELDRIGFPEGDFGKGIQNMSIVNGNLYDINSTLIYNTHLVYLDGYVKSGFLLDFFAPIVSFFTCYSIQVLLEIFQLDFLANAFALWGSSKIHLHAEINPFSYVNAGEKISELTFSYTKKFLWLFPRTYNLFSSSINSPNSELFYDDYPGSTYDIDISGNDTPYLQTVSGKQDNLFSYYFTLGVTNKIMFIPTASSLSILGDLTPYVFSRDYYNYRPIPEIETPFDSYYLYSYSAGHIELLNQQTFNWNWVKNHLDYDITGPEYLSDETTYSIPGYSGNLNWSTSNNNIATIDNSGRLTAVGNGIISIIAESYENGQLFRKKKSVLVGFPDIVIKSTYFVDEGYRFVAESTSAKATNILKQMVESGDFQYEWSFIDSKGNMTTSLTSSNSFSYMPSADENITIAVRLVNGEGAKGPTKSLTFNMRTPMSVNYKYVIVDSQQNAYFITSGNSYETFPTQSFAATFRQIAINPIDNVNLNGLRQRYLKGNDCYLSIPIGIQYISYMKGVLKPLSQSWSFDFFNQDIFLDTLENALSGVSGNERVIHDFHLSLCNSLKEKLQNVPFVIIYKPVFPEN